MKVMILHINRGTYVSWDLLCYKTPTERYSDKCLSTCFSIYHTNSKYASNVNLIPICKT